MIQGHEKFRMIDNGGKNDFFLEVNWNPDDETTNECKVLKITFPDKSVAYIKKEHLNAVLFAIGTEVEQRQMIPQKLVKTRWYETVLSVKATKDIRRGENITFPVKLSLPDQTDEIIGNIKKKDSGILLPK